MRGSVFLPGDRALIPHQSGIGRGQGLWGWGAARSVISESVSGTYIPILCGAAWGPGVDLLRISRDKKGRRKNRGGSGLEMKNRKQALEDKPEGSVEGQ